jgi:heme exporter protein C
MPQIKSTTWQPGKTYWLITLSLFIAGLAMLRWYTPVEETMGAVQKVFYLHLPVAINTFVACLICFVAGFCYLWQRRSVWDDLSAAAARIAVLLCTVVLLTGMIWGRAAWGAWWTWSPRLTFSLVLWLLYVVYLIVRPSIESRHRRAVICAVYAVVAFLDVPLVYLSTKMMPDIHPTRVGLGPEMKYTLLFWFLPVTMLNIGLLAAQFGLERRHSSPMADDLELPEQSSKPAAAGV